GVTLAVDHATSGAYRRGLVAKPTDILQRRRFDFEVLRDMQCDTFRSEAYASTDDLNHRRRQITSMAEAGRASKYRFLLRIRTLTGPGKFAAETEIGIDTEVVDYPRNAPNTWILSPHVPWSPHFLKNSPICIGEEFWAARKGHVTLGHLAVHIARMLNWDEKGRGAGYRGWNGEAIRYHQRHFGGRPLDSNVVYPNLPSWLTATDPNPT